MDDDTTNVAEGLSRRELLKRAATVGAAAWTAPIVATFNTPALAGNGNDVSPIECGPWSCGDPLVVCGHPAPELICACVNDVEGNSFCAGDAGCDDLRDCGTSDDCQDGWRCVANTCCEVPKCLPPCGTNGPSQAITNRSAGATAFRS